jgi:hypothetical protein
MESEVKRSEWASTPRKGGGGGGGGYGEEEGKGREMVERTAI